MSYRLQTKVVLLQDLSMKLLFIFIYLERLYALYPLPRNPSVLNERAEAAVASLAMEHWGTCPPQVLKKQIIGTYVPFSLHSSVGGIEGTYKNAWYSAMVDADLVAAQFDVVRHKPG